jgi:hypothetical protein
LADAEDPRDSAALRVNPQTVDNAENLVGNGYERRAPYSSQNLDVAVLAAVGTVCSTGNHGAIPSRLEPQPILLGAWCKGYAVAGPRHVDVQLPVRRGRDAVEQLRLDAGAVDEVFDMTKVRDGGGHRRAGEPHDCQAGRNVRLP